jgi:hypothetical protein
MAQWQAFQVTVCVSRIDTHAEREFEKKEVKIGNFWPKFFSFFSNFFNLLLRYEE